MHPHYIELTYYLASGLSIIAAAPQIKQLLVVKCSDELNFTTWITWLVYQITALAYAISVHATAYMVACLLWISFYLIMLSLMYKYRNNALPQPVPVEVGADISKSQTS